MSLAVHCSSRRLLHSLSVATGSVHIYTPDKTALKKRRRALLFAHKERRIDRATREALTESLYDILRHRRLPGLIDRRDTYVSVRDLLNYQSFRMLTFPNLQKVVNEDRWHRFELLYEPLKGRDDESWWIRVKNMNERYITIKPILSTKDFEVAIYSTTLQAWKSYVSLKGISRQNNDHIKLSLGVAFDDFFTSKAPLTAQVFIHINIWHAITMGIPFSYASKPSFSTHNLRADVTNSDSPDSQLRQPPLTKSIISHFKQKLTWIITPGNNFGFLPPECFSKVEFITIKRKVLWTSDEGGAVLEQEPKYMASPKTKRTTSKKDLDQFFDFPKYRRRVVHSDLKKEARAIFSA